MKNKKFQEGGSGRVVKTSPVVSDRAVGSHRYALTITVSFRKGL